MSLEPTDVGPIAGGHLPASPDDRAVVAQRLRVAHAQGRLTTQDLAARLGAAANAQTFDDLVPLTRDLPSTAAPPGSSLAPLPGARPTNTVARVDRSHQAPPERLLGIFGGTTRRGAWRLRRETTAVCVFGGHTLDLREAVFEDDVCYLTVQAFLGGVDVLVPAGVRVLSELTCIVGGIDMKGLDSAGLSGPTLVIRGVACFGGVDVKGPRRHKLARMMDA